jgi:hypothetical protein
MIRIVGTVMVLLFPLSQVSYAWNSTGHMAVAFVAYKNLNATTRVRVDRLIRLNPRYNEWAARLPLAISDSSRRGMLFMLASTWVDEIKSDSRYRSDPLGDSMAAANNGYADMLLHTHWHYVDIPFSVDGTPLPPTPTPNARTQIPILRAVLRSSTASDQLRSYDLVWLLHLVGDVHQPLHVATRVSSRWPNGDSGGHQVTICNPQCGFRLHAFWDNLLGTDTNPAAVIKIGLTLPHPNPILAGKLNEDDWIDESFSLAKSVVYQPPVGLGTGPYLITAAYRSKAQSVARQQVVLAGIRLAKILNDELK